MPFPLERCLSRSAIPVSTASRKKTYRCCRIGVAVSRIQDVLVAIHSKPLLYDFQEPSQRCRSKFLVPISRKQNGQPEAHGIRRLERRRNDVASCRWQGSGAVNFMSVFPRGYVRRQRDSSFNSEIDVTPRIMPRVYDITEILAAGELQCSRCLRSNN